MASSFFRFLDHSKRSSIVGRTPGRVIGLSQHLYLTLHNKQLVTTPLPHITQQTARHNTSTSHYTTNSSSPHLYLTLHNKHNTQTSIRTRNPNNRNAADLHLRPRGHRDWLLKYYQSCKVQVNCVSIKLCNSNYLNCCTSHCSLSAVTSPKLLHFTVQCLQYLHLNCCTSHCSQSAVTSPKLLHFTVQSVCSNFT